MELDLAVIEVAVFVKIVCVIAVRHCAVVVAVAAVVTVKMQRQKEQKCWC